MHLPNAHHLPPHQYHSPSLGRDVRRGYRVCWMCSVLFIKKVLRKSNSSLDNFSPEVSFKTSLSILNLYSLEAQISSLEQWIVIVESCIKNRRLFTASKEQKHRLSGLEMTWRPCYVILTGTKLLQNGSSAVKKAFFLSLCAYNQSCTHLHSQTLTDITRPAFRFVPGEQCVRSQ